MIALFAQLRVAVELWRWRRVGLRPVLWWRDDDARTATPELERLLGMAQHRPLALAVIPDGNLAKLAERLVRSPNVSVGQHGVDHINRSEAGEHPSEHPAAATTADLAGSIGEARARMEAASLAPRFFTPPWNGCQPTLPEALVASGFDLLSAGKTATAADGLRYLSAEIDILSWKTGARFKGKSRVLHALGKALAVRRKTNPNAPIGLLTHHLVHDDESWRFLAWFVVYADNWFEWANVDAQGA